MLKPIHVNERLLDQWGRSGVRCQSNDHNHIHKRTPNSDTLYGACAERQVLCASRGKSGLLSAAGDGNREAINGLVLLHHVAGRLLLVRPPILLRRLRNPQLCGCISFTTST